MRFFLFALLCLPFIELYTLVKVASAIGVFSAVLLVILASVVGTALIKQQGFNSLQRIQSKLELGAISSLDIADGLLLGISGLLFFIPGFVTDILALILLIPFSRRLVARVLFNTLQPTTFHSSYQQNTTRIIEGEVVDDDAPSSTNHRLP